MFWHFIGLKLLMAKLAIFKRIASHDRVKSISWFLLGLSVKILFIVMCFVFIVSAPDIHKSLLREYVGSQTFMLLKSNGGGGTGFVIKAPSGKPYIITNDHICAGNKTNYLYAENLYFGYQAEILERSRFTDLCLLSAPTNWSGLSMARDVYYGDSVRIIGHPKLFPLTVSNIGEIIYSRSQYLSENVKNKSQCDLSDPKYFYGEDKKRKYCSFFIPDAYQTNIHIEKGNSGSAVVNMWGEVKGVVAGLNESKWAIVVSLDSLKEFLKDK
jgi:S1-C subfamily serine protease